MAAVEGARVARAERPHGARQRGRAGPDHTAELIRHQRPGVHAAPFRDRRLPQPPDEVVPVLGIAEDGPTFHPPHHDMVQGAGRTFRTQRGRASRPGWRGMGGTAEQIAVIANVPYDDLSPMNFVASTSRVPPELLWVELRSDSNQFQLYKPFTTFIGFPPKYDLTLLAVSSIR